MNAGGGVRAVTTSPYLKGVILIAQYVADKIRAEVDAHGEDITL